MGDERDRYFLRGPINFVALLLAAIPLSALLNVVLIPRPAAAQVIKPPPVILGGSPARAGAPVPPFRPLQLVYRQAEGEGFRKPAGVFVDPATGEVLVADSGSNLVTLLSRAGVPRFAFGYNGEVPQPTKVGIDRQGRIFVLAGVPRKVKVFSYRGEPLGDFAFPGFAGAAPALPTALAVDAAGTLYVAEATSGQILVYAPDGRLLRRVGHRGEGPGAFQSVTALTVDAAGTLYVADARNQPAIQVFDAQGTYLRGWGEHSGGPHNVSLPSGIAVDAGGRVFVTDTIRQTVAVYTAAGRYLLRFGDLGTGPGQLGFPSDVALEGASRLYVTEAANARLQVFELTEAPIPPAAPSPGPRDREGVRQGVGDVLRGIVK